MDSKVLFVFIICDKKYGLYNVMNKKKRIYRFDIDDNGSA